MKLREAIGKEMGNERIEKYTNKLYCFIVIDVSLSHLIKKGVVSCIFSEDEVD